MISTAHGVFFRHAECLFVWSSRSREKYKTLYLALNSFLRDFTSVYANQPESHNKWSFVIYLLSWQIREAVGTRQNVALPFEFE